MNNLEKLISNLSNYWGISPDKVVDRLNFMNEQEINKIVDKMTKKFKNGGLIDCLRNGGEFSKCMKCGGKTLKAEGGEKVLPRFAKIIEGGGPYNNPRRIYYANNRTDLQRMPQSPRDGDIFSEERSVDPTVYWSNEIAKAAQPFGMRYPVRPTEYAQPNYLMYIQHDNSGLNLQSADHIDRDKAAVETSDKIKTIRGIKRQDGGELKKKMSAPPKKKQNLLKTKK